MNVRCERIVGRPYRAPGFTLVEILIVISIIVLLMSLLIPAISSAARAVKSQTAASRVAILSDAIMAYKRVYGACPLDRVPGGVAFQDTSQDGNYPPYYYPDGTKGVYLFEKSPDDADTGTGNRRGYGGKFLVYFLMGPESQGWHRKSTNTIIAKRNAGLTAEWDPPPVLTSFLINRPVEQGCFKPKTFAVFADGFGLEGNNGGTIGYIAASAYGTGTSRWTIGNGPFNAAFYEDCRSHPSYPGDDKANDQLLKILGQCPEGVDFMVISPGPDRRFGYRVTVMEFNGTERKGSWSNMAAGVIDDIANFPLK